MSDEETASILRALKEQLNRVEMRQMEIIERLRLINELDYALEGKGNPAGCVQPRKVKESLI